MISLKEWTPSGIASSTCVFALAFRLHSIWILINVFRNYVHCWRLPRHFAGHQTFANPWEQVSGLGVIKTQWLQPCPTTKANTSVGMPCRAYATLYLQSNHWTPGYNSTTLFQCIAQPNTTLLACMLYLIQYPYDAGIYQALQISVSLGKCIWDSIYQGNSTTLTPHKQWTNADIHLQPWAFLHIVAILSHMHINQHWKVKRVHIHLWRYSEHSL